MFNNKLAEWYGKLPVIRELRELTTSVRQLGERMSALQLLRFLDWEAHHSERFRDPLRLLRHQMQVCSQNGEDGILHEIFRRIGATNRVFVEIGVGDGTENNTAFLLSQGWTGFWIDGADHFLQTLRRRRRLTDQIIRSHVSQVTQENADAILRTLGAPDDFDLLSLDIDQNTYFVWQGLSRFRPRVVVVEYNSAIPADVEWTVQYDPKSTWNGSQNFGASLKSFENLGRRLGYSLVGCECIGANAFFVRDELTAGRFATPFTAENHYEPPRYALSSRRSHPPDILDRRPTLG